jgi:hypothetical protein
VVAAVQSTGSWRPPWARTLACTPQTLAATPIGTWTLNLVVAEHVRDGHVDEPARDYRSSAALGAAMPAARMPVLKELQKPS